MYTIRPQRADCTANHLIGLPVVFPTKKLSGLDNLHCQKINQTFRKELASIFKLFQNIEEPFQTQSAKADKATTIKS